MNRYWDEISRTLALTPTLSPKERGHLALCWLKFDPLAHTAAGYSEALSGCALAAVWLANIINHDSISAYARTQLYPEEGKAFAQSARGQFDAVWPNAAGALGAARDVYFHGH